MPYCSTCHTQPVTNRLTESADVQHRLWHDVTHVCSASDNKQLNTRIRYRIFLPKYRNIGHWPFYRNRPFSTFNIVLRLLQCGHQWWRGQILFFYIDTGDLPMLIRWCSSSLRCRQFSMSDVCIGRTLSMLHPSKCCQVIWHTVS